MKRILHLIGLSVVGGVERMYADFLSQSSPWPVEHITLMQRPKISSAIKDVVYQRSQVHNFTKLGFVKIPRKPSWLRQYNRERVIKKFKPDLIMVWNDIFDVQAVSKSVLASYPVIYYEHGGAWYLLEKSRTKKFFSYVNNIVAVSHAAKRMLQLKHEVTLPIEVCHNAVTPNLEFKETEARTLSNNRPVRLGCAARLVPLKCFGLAVLTVKKLRDLGIQAEALIAGTGRERKTIEALIEKYSLQDSVKVMGFTKDMASFYREIDFFLCTSMHESYSLVNIEAAAWGVPVIASNVDGIPESVIHNHTGLCLTPTLSRKDYQKLTNASVGFDCVYWPENDSIGEPKMLDPQAIAEAVLTLYNDPVRYHQMSRNAVEHSKNRPDFSALCAKLYDIMDKTMNHYVR